MAWNNINKSKEAADKGFKSIVVPYQSLYLDMMQVPLSRVDVNEKYSHDCSWLTPLSPSCSTRLRQSALLFH